MEVTFSLRCHGRPQLRYPELRDCVEARVDLAHLESGRPALSAVREAVLYLRRKKSMVVDPCDPNSRSAGSFFLNPRLSGGQLRNLEQRWQAAGGVGAIPMFESAEGFKVAAAWLVEQAGFGRGYRRGGVGISAHHALALINCGGTARAVLELAADIQRQVGEIFGIHLEIEPVVVPS